MVNNLNHESLFDGEIGREGIKWARTVEEFNSLSAGRYDSCVIRKEFSSPENDNALASQ